MKGSTCAYGMVRDGKGSRILRPIIGRMWASSSRTISRSPVSICVLMVRCSFRSSPLLVVVAHRRFRPPAGAAARLVAEGLVLGPPTAAEGCTDLAHAPGWHVDAQVSAQVYRSVGDELYPGRLLGLLTLTLLQPVVKRPARAATYDLGYLLRGGVLRLDPRPLVDVEDLRQATHALFRRATWACWMRCCSSAASPRQRGTPLGRAWCARFSGERLKVAHATFNWRVGGAFATAVTKAVYGMLHNNTLGNRHTSG